MKRKDVRHEPPLEHKLPSEDTLPEQFPLPEEYMIPPEPSPGPERAPLPPEFHSSGKNNSFRMKRKNIWRMATMLFSLILLAVAVYEAGLPEAGDMTSSIPPDDATQVQPNDNSMQVPPSAEELPPDPPDDATQVQPNDNPMQVPPSAEELPPEPKEESSIYTATIGGSYGLIDVTLADPETISSAKITMFDQISGETYYEDQFGTGIPQEDIKAGHYSTTYYNYVPDFEAYWAANGEGAFPDFAFTLTIERTDGESEEYASEHMGDGPSSISVRYEKDAGAVKVRLYNLLGEDFIPVVCGAPEDAAGETVSVTVFVDGQPIPQENYTVADETEESQVSHMDTPDEVETVTDYIRVITATLPQPISADAKATVALDMELNGHRFTYTSPIA